MKIYVVKSDEEKQAFEIKEKIREKFDDAKDWVKNHKEYIIAYGPIAISGVATIAKVVGRHINLHKAESVKNLYCYDRSLGHYWALRRELSNKEWLEVDRRKRNGERLADILSELRVLK